MGRRRDGHCGWLPDQLPSKLELVWEEPLVGPGLGGVAATSKYVLIGDRDLQDTGDEFRCYSAVDGSFLWMLAYPAPGQLDYGNTPRATPLIVGDKVYLQGAFGDLHCVELETGAILWSRNYGIDFEATEELPWGTCGTPLLVDDKLIINPGAPQASVVALNPENGDVIWQTPGDTAAYGSFVAGELGGVKQVVGHDKHSLGGWDVKTGKRLWQLAPPEADDFNVPTPMIIAGKLLVTSENNGTRLYEFNQGGIIRPQPVAENADLASDIGSPIVVGKKVFAVWGELFCLDLENGLKTSWLGRDKSFRQYGSILVNGERMLLAGASGELLLMNTASDDYEVLSRLKVFDYRNAELYSHPAMVGSRLYMRGEDVLVCVELNPEQEEK